MKKHLFYLSVALLLVSCGSKSQTGNESSDETVDDSYVEAEAAVNFMTPKEIIDNYVNSVVEIDGIMARMGRDASEKEIRNVEDKFDRVCSEAIKRLEMLNKEERNEAYEYWAQITKNPKIRALRAFDLDTHEGQRFAKYIENMRVDNDENIIGLIGNCIEFTDKAGTGFRLHLYECEPDASQRGECMLYSRDLDKEFTGKWYFQSRDLGMASLNILIDDTRKGYTDEEAKCVDFGEAHVYHNDHYQFYPGSSALHFYIVKGKIWPYFISTDGFNGYEQFSFPYEVCIE